MQVSLPLIGIAVLHISVGGSRLAVLGASGLLHSQMARSGRLWNSSFNSCWSRGDLFTFQRLCFEVEVLFDFWEDFHGERRAH